MTHSELVNSTLLFLAPLGIAWSNPTGALRTDDRFIRYGQPGSPDVLACVKGRIVGVECKVGEDRQSPIQQRFAEVLSRNDVAARLRLEGLL